MIFEVLSEQKHGVVRRESEITRRIESLLLEICPLGCCVLCDFGDDFEFNRHSER